ncbi:hypothetical protein [Falsiroseomonas sp. HW251]|uniref:hypothetical protein n=1 Tax=Falsiroseomonas sp. HW251 TaxID=3390998 RepID=UPI003D3203B2
MSEIDRVFARFRDDKSRTAERREQRSISQRGSHGTQTSRTVEVVHVRSGARSRQVDPSRAPSFGVRSASWDDGFPARDAPPAFPGAPKPAVAAAVAPTFHVMPARSPSVPASEAAPVAPDSEPVVEGRRSRGRPRKQPVVAPARRVADPFDANDVGANCLRCGYVVEPAREKHGLMTCAACG